MKRPFTSIRHPLAIDGGLGKLAEEPDYARHIEQLMRQILLTAPGERVNRPDFGCGLRRYLFSPNSEANAGLVKVQVAQALAKWLGTAIAVDSVEVSAVDATLNVTIAYVLLVRREKRWLNLEVT
jgi:uncharacterized protein